MDSILTSIKKLLGIEESYTHFDSDITMHINSVFMILNQLGVGPPEGFVITGSNEQWSDFIPNDSIKLELVKSYTYLKVALIFDTNRSPAAMESMNRMVNEFEWRLNVAAETD